MADLTLDKQIRGRRSEPVTAGWKRRFGRLFEGRGDERRHVGRIHKFKLVDRRAYVDMGLRVIGGYKEDNKQYNPGESLAEMLKGMKRSALPVVAQVEPDKGL